MARLPDGVTTLNMRIDRELLMFLKHTAIKKGVTMTTLVAKCLNDMKKRAERKEAPTDDNV